MRTQLCKTSLICVVVLGVAGNWALADSRGLHSATDSAITSDAIDRLLELHRQTQDEARRVMKLVRRCDEELNVLEQQLAQARTVELAEKIRLTELTKLKALEAVRKARSQDVVDYLVDHFLYVPRNDSSPRGGLFVQFRCADALAKMDEATAIQGVLGLVNARDLTPEEQVFCARYIYEIARNPDRRHALGKNLLLQDIERYDDKIRIAKDPDMLRALERLRNLTERNVEGILAHYEQILENNDLALQRFYAAKAEIWRQQKSNYTIP